MILHIVWVNVKELPLCDSFTIVRYVNGITLLVLTELMPYNQKQTVIYMMIGQEHLGDKGNHSL